MRTLCVTNIGQGAAFSPKVSFVPDLLVESSCSLPIAKKGKVSKASILKMPLIKPRQSFEAFVAWDKEISPRQTVVHIECKDTHGKIHTSSNEIDMDALRDCSFGATNEKTMATAQKEISQILSSISQGRSLNIKISREKDNPALKVESLKEAFRNSSITNNES